MTTDTKTAWRMKAAYLETCSCDFGCPCNFEAPPTKGYCSFVLGWHINEGHFGDVSLDGLNIAGAGWFPEAMHLGNGTMIPYVDERATPEQRSALLTIMTGAAGGLPWEILAAIISDVREPRFVPIDFNVDGRHSTVKIADLAEAGLTPIKNPVTGDEEDPQVVLPHGFLFHHAHVAESTASWVKDDGIDRDQTGQNGYFAEVDYSTPSEGAIVLRLIAVPQSDRGPVLAILAALGLLAWLTLADPLGLGIASAFDHHELLEDASGSQIVARFPLFVGRGR